ALVCGWWFVRNLLLYGELMGVQAWLSHTETVRPEPLGFLEVIPQLQGLEMSYWAIFGWFNVAVSPWLYRAWWVLVRLAVVGLLVLLAEQWTQRRLPPRVRAGLAIVALSFLLVFGSVWRFIMIVLGAQGRYLFPAVAGASTLLTLGLARLVGQRGEGALAGLLAVTHLGATLGVLLIFILPAYAQPRSVMEEDLPERMTRFEVTAAGTPIRLIGGLIEVEEVRPGRKVPATLYWEARTTPEVDYVVHVRLLGRDGEPIGGTDGYPGGGTFPPTLWEPGVIYRDRYLIPVDEGAAAPALVGLEAGVRLRGGAPITPTLPSGEPLPGMPLLDTVPLRALKPPPTRVAYPVGARLGETFTLIGADLSTDHITAGDTLTVTLVWRAELPPSSDYTVFVHLLNEEGELIAQSDAPPLDGSYPTSWWASGETVRDPHILSLPHDLPPARYPLQVGLYDLVSGARLMAIDAAGNQFAQNAIPVTTLEGR
ncbi:MAG: hypothetical protein PVH62_10140, partial [Anaerolineae bacterium]